MEGWTDGADTKKLIGDFLKYINVPKTNEYSKEFNNKPVYTKKLLKNC